MKQIKPILLIVALLLVITFLVPTILVLPFSTEKVSGKLDEKLQKPIKSTEPSVEVAVYRTKTNQIEKPNLEDYVVGVVASEMPVTFKKEALKAQALTARTYIVKQLLYGNTSVPKGADVEDTQNFQVYQNINELKTHWGSDYTKNIKKIREAVEETAGQILTYNGSPITASFFSTSNGYTENSEDYWDNAVPYLKSVKSPWDKTSPKFSYQQSISVTDFENKLGIHLASNQSIGTVTSLTHGKRVGTVEIGGKTFTGRQVREKLNLRSTDFSWIRKGDQIIVTTKGFGHGIGMSQYGANGMAKEGKNYQDIVKYYYKGIQISNSDQFLNKVTAKR